MSAPQMTTELQNDLKLLRMRNALNPSQHYKSSDWKKLPRYFQVSIMLVSGHYYGEHSICTPQQSVQWRELCVCCAILY